MNNQVEAVYFDGQTSEEKVISLLIDEELNALCLQTADGERLLWELKDLIFESYGTYIEIRNQEVSGACLQVEDEFFKDDFYALMKANRRVDIHSRLLNLGFSKILLIALALLVGAVCAYVYLLPPLAERTARLLPDSFDSYLGDEFMKTFLKENEVDEKRSKALEQFVAELNLPNKERLNFMVVKSDEVNAFALPNGQVVVYTAILDKMTSTDELVALLAHETAHISQRHSVQMLARNLSSYLFVSIIFSDINGVMAVLAENAHRLNTLAYSRGFEQEADELGFQTLVTNKVNPQGMINLFNHLKEESFDMPEIIQTHPSLGKRKAYIQKLIDEGNYPTKKRKDLECIFEQVKRQS